MSGVLTTGKLVLTNTVSNQDAFDRLRVSEPNTLFEYVPTLGKLPTVISEVFSGSGTSVAKLNESYIEMKLANSGVGKVVRQSYEYIQYQAGKSKLMILTGILEVSGGVPDVIARIGCFDSSVEKTVVAGSGNGLFFELNGTTMYVVMRLNNVDTKVARNNWNFDTFNGSGPSGLTITDFSKAMIFAIDQEWLGVGRVRFGFFINGVFHLAHSFNNSGIGEPTSTAITSPYTKTAKLPIRYEISSTVARNAEMRMICSTVISEGGFEPYGLNFSIGRLTAILISSEIKPIISLRLRPEEPFNRKTILIKGIDIYNSASRSIQWDLFLLPSTSTLTASDWVNINETNSVAQYDVSSTAVNLTGAILVASGYADLQANTTFNFDKYLSSPLLNSSIDGTPRVLCLAGIKLTNQDVSVFGSMTWIELL